MSLNLEPLRAFFRKRVSLVLRILANFTSYLAFFLFKDFHPSLSRASLWTAHCMWTTGFHVGSRELNMDGKTAKRHSSFTLLVILQSFWVILSHNSHEFIGIISSCLSKEV